MKRIAIIFILILITNCNTGKKNDINKRVSEISNIIKNELIDDKINSDVLINYSNDEHLVNVDIIFDKPYRITDKYTQFELVSYLVYQINKNKLINDSEELKIQLKYKDNSFKKLYSVGVFNKGTKFSVFNNKTYVNLLKYCLKEFDMSFALFLNKQIEEISLMFPYIITKKESFFNLLKEFSKTKNPSLQNNADVTFMLYHYYTKFIIDNVDKYPISAEKLKMRKKELKIIKDLWLIAKGKYIDEEKDFENEVLDPKNHKQKES